MNPVKPPHTHTQLDPRIESNPAGDTVPEASPLPSLKPTGAVAIPEVVEAVNFSNKDLKVNISAKVCVIIVLLL